DWSSDVCSSVLFFPRSHLIVQSSFPLVLVYLFEIMPLHDGLLNVKIFFVSQLAYKSTFQLFLYCFIHTCCSRILTCTNFKSRLCLIKKHCMSHMNGCCFYLSFTYTLCHHWLVYNITCNCFCCHIF